jgi:glycosyltransferase involved in cell wall biosynthesis
MTDRIRVLFAIGSLGCGGSERQLLNILTRLDRSRFEPHLYLLDRSGEFLAEVPNDVSITAFSDDAQPGGIYVPGKIFRQQVSHLTEHLRSSRFDVLYDRTFLMPPVTGPATKATGVPRISTITADPDRDLTNNLNRFVWLKKKLIGQAYREAACVVGVSDGVRRSAETFYDLDAAKTRTIYNGFDFEQIRSRAADECPIELPGDEDSFRIACVGRLQHEKGVDVLLRALKIAVHDRGLVHVRLLAVGDGPDADSLMSLSHDLRLEKFVTFVGFQPNPNAILARCRLLCLPSRYEGMPNALVEALACGLATIASNCPHGPREILEDERLGELVTPEDETALASAIERAVEKPSTEADQTRRVESVEARFSINSSMGQLEELLAEISHQPT